MAKDRVGTVVSIPCNNCGVTKHTVRGSYNSYWDDGEEHGVSGGATHDLLECNGCSRGTYRISSWFSEEPDPVISFWPPRKSDAQLREPRKYHNLEWGSAVESVYRQTMAAFNHGLSTLAAAGVRLLIEGICLDHNVLKGKTYTDEGKLVRDKHGKVAKRDNLDGKINGLHTKGLISKTQASVLHQIRKLGNDAAHVLIKRH